MELNEILKNVWLIQEEVNIRNNDKTRNELLLLKLAKIPEEVWELHNEVLKKILALEENFFLSLGGGTPCYYNNHELLNATGILSIYLKATTDTLVKRLMNEKNSRPLLHNQEENALRDFINKHLFDRNFYYHQANKIITVDNKSIEKIANEINSLLA